MGILPEASLCNHLKITLYAEITKTKTTTMLATTSEAEEAPQVIALLLQHVISSSAGVPEVLQKREFVPA